MAKKKLSEREKLFEISQKIQEPSKVPLAALFPQEPKPCSPKKKETKKK